MLAAFALTSKDLMLDQMRAEFHAHADNVLDTSES